MNAKEFFIGLIIILIFTTFENQATAQTLISSDPKIRAAREMVKKIKRAYPKYPGLGLFEKILNEPDFTGVLREWGCTVIFDDKGIIEKAYTLKAKDFKTGMRYKIRRYTQAELNDARSEILNYKKMKEIKEHYPIPIFSHSLKLAVAEVLMDPGSSGRFMVGRGGGKQSHEMQVIFESDSTKKVLAADAVYIKVGDMGEELSAEEPKQISKFDMESLIAYEYEEAVSQAVPPPEPGFGVSISSDFDQMLLLAPVLDPDDTRFHEGNAVFWHEQFGKIIVVAMSQISGGLLEIFMKAQDNLQESVDSPLKPLRGILEQLRLYEVVNHKDEFVRRFLLAYFSDWIRLGEIAIEVDVICKNLNRANSHKDLQASATELRTYAEELRWMIYRPSIDRRDVPRRKALWRTLKRLALQAETEANQLYRSQNMVKVDGDNQVQLLTIHKSDFAYSPNRFQQDFLTLLKHASNRFQTIKGDYISTNGWGYEKYGIQDFSLSDSADSDLWKRPNNSWYYACNLAEGSSANESTFDKKAEEINEILPRSWETRINEPGGKTLREFVAENNNTQVILKLRSRLIWLYIGAE